MSGFFYDFSTEYIDEGFPDALHGVIFVYFYEAWSDSCPYGGLELFEFWYIGLSRLKNFDDF